MSLTKEIVIDAIRPVEDPDMGMSLVDMGLIYEVAIDDSNNINIQMTLSSPSCPVAPQLLTDVEMSVRSLKEANKIKIDLVWEPEWDPETMATDEVKDILGIW
jgi:metal-sulfur cluster biosynthetic enzyme